MGHVRVGGSSCVMKKEITFMILCKYVTIHNRYGFSFCVGSGLDMTHLKHNK